MKEYKFSKLVIVIDWLFVILALVALLVAGRYLPGSKDNIIRSGIVAVAVAVFGIPMMISHSKRYVQLSSDSIGFKSFHIGTKYQDADIPYAMVTSLSKKFYPNLKWSVLSIKAQGYDKPILVDFTISEHNELFTEICKRVRLANPNVEIDPKLEEYLSN